jgi:hypothetical protein
VVEEMNEKELLQLWNEKRSQIISAQMAPSLVLIGILVIAGFGKFDSATDSVKYLAIAVAAATGILAVISQYAAIREASALVADINKLSGPSALATKVGASGKYLSLTAVIIVALSAAIFALVVTAILG